jgi:acyl-CoA thioesterase FadM
MNRPEFPSVRQVRQLPRSFHTVVPPEWADRNDHVNVQFFLTLYELSGWVMMDGLELDDQWFRQRHLGEFDLEHHVFYRSEIRIGDRVSTYHRVVGRSDKRFHGMLFIINDSRERLAATLEFVTTAVDMQRRRTTELPTEICQGLDRLLQLGEGLDWSPPLCGVMAP